ncbi:hypothetical protein KY285_001324 [Solanum tuberosum]|nr:hypothetical protein KY285_001324 [Solanum tuberosum]
METIQCWWYVEAPSKLRLVFRAIPALILWSLWKRRNHIKHGGQLNLEGMVKQVTKNIQMLTSGRNAGLNLFGKNWLEMKQRQEQSKKR